jgi:hypothetical protein
MGEEVLVVLRINAFITRTPSTPACCYSVSLLAIVSGEPTTIWDSDSIDKKSFIVGLDPSG